MFATLSQKQRQILNYDQGCVVAKACPGSGKTFSVAARIAKLIGDKKFSNKGIAVMSFTNVAGDEIHEKLKNHFNISTPLPHPHFLGTIDRFINQFIFLPHGHLVMDCNKRPELIGPPHRSWTKGKGDRTYRNAPGRGRVVSTANPHGYFDATSFNIHDELYSLVPAQQIHFSLKRDKYYNRDGRPKKLVQDVINAKWENFRLGFANQADANYLSWKILTRFPLIAKAIAGKFDYFIIDEAQDTDAIQMCIIDILQQAGARNIMLVGDRDQSIFEWNNADPANFDRKYNEWDKIDLDENWRSSQHICNFTQPLSSFTRCYAVDPAVAKFTLKPEILGYSPDNPSTLNSILSRFFGTCEQNGISIDRKDVAVLYRGRRMERYLGTPISDIQYGNLPWVPHNYHVKDILLGKTLLDNGDFRRGYKLLEKGYLEAIHKVADNTYHCSAKLIDSYIETEGFSNFRDKVFKFIRLLPMTRNVRLNTWIRQVNTIIAGEGMAFRLSVEMAKSNILIDDLLADELDFRQSFPFFSGTIHSAKGKTFNAVMLILGKRAGSHSNYSKMLTQGPNEKEAEELRNVYVAITRPRRILFLVVPTDDVPVWSSKLSNP